MTVTEIVSRGIVTSGVVVDDDDVVGDVSVPVVLPSVLAPTSVSDVVSAVVVSSSVVEVVSSASVVVSGSVSASVSVSVGLRNVKLVFTLPVAVAVGEGNPPASFVHFKFAPHTVPCGQHPVRPHRGSAGPHARSQRFGGIHATPEGQQPSRSGHFSQPGPALHCSEPPPLPGSSSSSGGGWLPAVSQVLSPRESTAQVLPLGQQYVPQ